jgi:arylsulfatase A-like enzyme
VQPVCSPTRATLMTGRHVIHNGVYSVVRPGARWGLPLAERTLAEALREAGYTTAICGKWHLGEFEEAYRPTRRGFDRQYGHWFGAIDYFTHLRDGKRDWQRDDQPCADEGYSTHLIAQESCRIIRDQPKEKPLFLYVPFNAVHAPHQVPAQYTQPYEKLKGTRRLYAGMLSAMDEAVGQIAAALEETGRRGNTMIIFSSDNGGPNPGKVTDNGPLRAGKGTLYEGGIRVCAFAAWPGRIPAGQRIKEPLSIADWYPTLIKLVGGSLEQKLPLDGRDILPLLAKGEKPARDALFLAGTQEGRAALRAGDWKLIGGKGDAKPELYNLATDPGERNNRAAAESDKLKELRTQLEASLADAVPFAGVDAAAAK